jgi:CheY-like chemotaxis protein
MEQSHILVVDDEAMIRLTLDALLSRRGYRVALAANGEQALAYVAANPVDLVLLDLIMAGMSGLEVAERVHALQPDTAILMLTGSDMLADVEQSGYSFIHKTALPEAVLTQIANVLAAHAQVH